MRVIFLAILLSWACLIHANPCSSPARYSPGQTVVQTITTPDGLDRQYQFYIPASYNTYVNTRVPVVVMLHGGGGNAQAVQDSTGWTTVSDQTGMISVFPQGWSNNGASGATWNAGACCGVAMTSHVEDTIFIKQMLAKIERLVCIDTTRVYATGFSNGAVMTHRLACETADVFAAIAPVEGTIEYANCKPSRPVPIFELHATSDLNIPFNGGHGCGGPTNWNSAPYTQDQWATHNGCPCSYSASLSNGCGRVVLTDADGVCTSYGPCAGGSDVQLCVIGGGAGHSWSGGSHQGKQKGSCNPTLGTFPATEHIWAFFTQHSNPGATTSGGTVSSGSSGSGGSTGSSGSSGGTASGFIYH